MAYHGRIGEYIDTSAYEQIAAIENLWLYQNAENPNYYQLTHDEIIVGIYSLIFENDVTHLHIIEIDRKNIQARETEKVIIFFLANHKLSELLIVYNDVEEVKRLLRYLPLGLGGIATTSQTPDGSQLISIRPEYSLKPMETENHRVNKKNLRQYEDTLVYVPTYTMDYLLRSIAQIESYDRIEKTLSEHNVRLSDHFRPRIMYNYIPLHPSGIPLFDHYSQNSSGWDDSRIEDYQKISFLYPPCIILHQGICILGEHYVLSLLKSGVNQFYAIDLGEGHWNDWMSDRALFV